MFSGLERVRQTSPRTAWLEPDSRAAASGAAPGYLLPTRKSWRLPNYIGTMAIDPFDSAHLRIGGVAPAPEDSGGMFASHDGGASWQRENVVSQFSYHCHSIVFHPVRRGVIFAAFDEHGARSGIWRSRDGGKTWDHLRKGLPDLAQFRRCRLVIAPSRPDSVYALAADQNDGLLGIFASSVDATSGGRSAWELKGKCARRRNCSASQGGRSPLGLGRKQPPSTADGGRTWKQATRWVDGRGTPELRARRPSRDCPYLPRLPSGSTMRTVAAWMLATTGVRVRPTAAIASRSRSSMASM